MTDIQNSTAEARQTGPIDAAAGPKETADGQHHRLYNFRHFWTKHVVMDLWRTAVAEGIHPGEVAPDFTLESTDGRQVQLASFRGKPVLLRFGSFT